MRRALGAVALLSCFAIALAGVVHGSTAWLKGARLGHPGLVLDYARMMGKRLPPLAEAGRGGRRTVAFLGDSGVVSYPAGQTVPERLQQVLDAEPAAGHPLVASLGMSGSGPFDYYCLADRIAVARPDVVVVSLNLDHFSDAWRSAYSRPQLAGWIAPGRIPDALGLPFHWIGLTTDRLLAYVVVVQAGASDTWYRLGLRQAQVGRARGRFESWLQGDDPPEERFREAADARTIARVFSGPDLRHYRRAGLLEHYRSTLDGIPPDHPVLEALTGTLRRLRAGGARVLVYLAPLEVTWLEEQGVLGEDGFRTTVARVRAAVEGSGGAFADLHDALPADSFRDAPGHLRHPPDGPDGPARLARLLRPFVLQALAQAPAAAR